jgi:cobalt/nickel transport system permease protein
MHHSFIDKYSDLKSPIHELDPGVKIIVFLVFIITLVLTPPSRLLQFEGFLAMMAAVAVLSRVPVSYILKRSLLVLPFVIFVALTIPFQHFNPNKNYFAVIFLKAWLSASALILLSSTTAFPDLLKGLEALKVPKLIVTLLSFMYRYIFVLTDEAMRMEAARDSRYFGGHYTRQLRVYSGMIGSLFIHTFERAERVYQCMAARGFTGKIKSLNRFEFSEYDVLFILFFAVSIVAIKIFL